MRAYLVFALCGEQPYDPMRRIFGAMHWQKHLLPSQSRKNPANMIGKGSYRRRGIRLSDSDENAKARQARQGPVEDKKIGRNGFAGHDADRQARPRDAQ